jgi:hypothetical protein
LKIGDTLPPTLTMMGKSTIHDFLRFSTNATGTPPIPATHTDEISGNDYNSSGFGGGAHRMMLANYDFVDPGVYAEDGNVNWSTDSGHPDWDGDTIGEGYEFVRVSDRDQMIKCEYQGIPTYLKVHVYSTFNEENGTLESIQNQLKNGQGYTSNAKTPETNSSGYAFTDLNKSSDPSKLRNLKVTRIDIEYRVMDGWGNQSNIAERRVYIYESSQYDNYAFYATPINGLENDLFGEMAAYYNNDSNVSYLTSFRKDTDGDGMSDYWEAVFDTDPKDPLDSNANWSLLNTNNLSTSDLKDRLRQNLGDASQLKDMNTWIDSNHTFNDL